MVRDWAKNIVDVFFPRLCAFCEKPLMQSEVILCVFCQIRLPITGFRSIESNFVHRLFYGRIPVFSANAFLNFRKMGMAQKLMHKLKYDGQTDIGYHLGKLFGESLKREQNWSMPDVLVTVPLHPDKERKRGYNQSDFIAEGLSEVLQIPFESKMLNRVQSKESQTLKKRFERWENIQSSFVVDVNKINGYRHIGIIDDVVTTGATFEACGKAIMEKGGLKISLLAMCLAIK